MDIFSRPVEYDRHGKLCLRDKLLVVFLFILIVGTMVLMGAAFALFNTKVDQAKRAEIRCVSSTNSSQWKLSPPMNEPRFVSSKNVL